MPGEDGVAALDVETAVLYEPGQRLRSEMPPVALGHQVCPGATGAHRPGRGDVRHLESQPAVGGERGSSRDEELPRGFDVFEHMEAADCLYGDGRRGGL